MEASKFGQNGEEQNPCSNRKPELKAEPLFHNLTMLLEVTVVEPILIHHETTQTYQLAVAHFLRTHVTLHSQVE